MLRLWLRSTQAVLNYLATALHRQHSAIHAAAAEALGLGDREFLLHNGMKKDVKEAAEPSRRLSNQSQPVRFIKGTEGYIPLITRTPINDDPAKHEDEESDQDSVVSTSQSELSSVFSVTPSPRLTHRPLPAAEDRRNPRVPVSGQAMLPALEPIEIPSKDLEMPASQRLETALQLHPYKDTALWLRYLLRAERGAESSQWEDMLTACLTHEYKQGLAALAEAAGRGQDLIRDSYRKISRAIKLHFSNEGRKLVKRRSETQVRNMNARPPQTEPCCNIAMGCHCSRRR